MKHANMPFEKAIDLYKYFIEKRYDEYFTANDFHKSLTMPTIEITKGGKRFVKVFKTEYADDGHIISKSIHSFVEKETGNVYKAASYKAPALNHVRANIYDYESLRNGVNHHGTNYMYR